MKRHAGWSIDYDNTRGCYRATRFGVGMSARSVDELRRMIDSRETREQWSARLAAAHERVMAYRRQRGIA